MVAKVGADGSIQWNILIVDDSAASRIIHDCDLVKAVQTLTRRL